MKRALIAITIVLCVGAVASAQCRNGSCRIPKAASQRWVKRSVNQPIKGWIFQGKKPIRNWLGIGR